MKRNILFLLSLCMLLLTCSDGNDPIKEIENKDPFISLKKSNIDFTNEGGSEAILIETNVTWTAKSSASWCTVSPSSGNKSTASITLSAPANEDYDNRSCTVTIESGGISKTITVNQGENLGLLITQDRYELGNEESTIKVEVKANVDFEVEINDEWISKIETRGLTTSEMEFKIAKNDTYDNRDGSITIKQKGGNLSSTIKVYQSQEDALILSEKNFNLSSEAQSVEVEIKTNIDFEIIIPEEAKEWVSHATTRALRTETVVLDVAENKEYDERTVEVIVKDKKTDLEETVTIKQAANTGLIISEDKYELTNDGGTIEVEVKANVEFDIEIADKWITRVETRGLTKTKLQFHVAKNENYDSREGTITIKQKGGNLSSIIKVYQSQKDAIIISEKDLELTSEAQAVEVELKTNIDYEIIIPEDAKDWVSHTKTRALRTETVVLDIAQNKDYDERTAKITIKDKKTNMQETVSIKQIANTGLIVSTDKYELSNDGGTIEVEVKANVEFDIEISDSWITQVKTRGLTTNILTFEIAKNEEFSPRHGVMLLKAGSLKKEIKVSQDGKKAEDNVWDGEIAESFYLTGEGSQSSPYLITTCGQIAKLIQNVNNGNSYKGQHFKLVANLNFNNYKTQPIGNKNNPFSGKFDGNNKTIKRLNILGDSHIALFGYTDQASIRNLTIFDSSINGKSYVGAFIGYASSTSIENCSSDVSIKSGKYIGGLIGAAKNSKIYNCNHQKQVVGNTSSSHIGGLVGLTENTHIINSYNSGKIYGWDCVGGLVGYSDKDSKIENCYNKGSFPDFYYSDTLGGIVGYNCGTIENCYSTGTMSGKTIQGDMGAIWSGGVVGYNHTTAFLSYCYFLKQSPINKMFSYCGDLNWGTNRKCGSFNASGVLEYGLAFSYNNLLRHSLNDWVNANQTGDNIYKQWRTDMGWPDFVE